MNVQIRSIDKAVIDDGAGCVGVRAVAELLIPHEDHYIVQAIESPGLWGIEAENGEDYLDAIYAEEKETLMHMLAALGVSEVAAPAGP